MQAGGGRAGGNILDLVAIMDGCSVREAALRLQDWSATLPARSPVPADDIPPAANAPLHLTLQHIDRHHPYLVGRGLTARTIRTFGLGPIAAVGSARSHIPIHNERGELVAYAGRAIDGQGPKYRFPTGFRKSLVLFNLHRALKTATRNGHRRRRLL
jgi:DNA primase